MTDITFNPGLGRLNPTDDYPRIENEDVWRLMAAYRKATGSPASAATIAKGLTEGYQVPFPSKTVIPPVFDRAEVGDYDVTDPEGRTGNPLLVAGSDDLGNNYPLDAAELASLASLSGRVDTGALPNLPQGPVLGQMASPPADLYKPADQRRRPGIGVNVPALIGLTAKGFSSQFPNHYGSSLGPDEDPYFDPLYEVLGHETGHAVHYLTANDASPVPFDGLGVPSYAYDPTGAMTAAGLVDPNRLQAQQVGDKYDSLLQVYSETDDDRSALDKIVDWVTGQAGREAAAIATAEEAARYGDYVASPEEAFAEGFRAYISDPAKFKSEHPEAAKMMRKMVNESWLADYFMLSENEQPALGLSDDRAVA